MRGNRSRHAEIRAYANGLVGSSTRGKSGGIKNTANGSGLSPPRSLTLRFFRFVTFAVVLAAIAVPASAATCAPQKLVHIVLTDVTPGVAAGSFAAQPRTYYRLGNNKLRIEEAPDQVNGIHGLIVVAEPDIWMINLFDKTGKHVVDPGPTFNAVAPVIAVRGVPAKLAGLELGCEAEFLAANALTPASTERIGTGDFAVYRMADAGDAIELLERKGTTTPAYARYYHQGKLVLVFHYDVYETGLPADPALFVPPAGVQLSGST